MRTLALGLAAALIGSAAIADETTVTKTDGPFGSSTTVRKERSDADVVSRSVESPGAVGCETKSVSKTNELGETRTKTKTDC